PRKSSPSSSNSPSSSHSSSSSLSNSNSWAERLIWLLLRVLRLAASDPRAGPGPSPAGRQAANTSRRPGGGPGAADVSPPRRRRTPWAREDAPRLTRHDARGHGFRRPAARRRGPSQDARRGLDDLRNRSNEATGTALPNQDPAQHGASPDQRGQKGAQ